MVTEDLGIIWPQQDLHDRPCKRLLETPARFVLFIMQAENKHPLLDPIPSPNLVPVPLIERSITSSDVLAN